jgi:alpha-tubulin suppressor-like RCC1 family protein
VNKGDIVIHDGNKATNLPIGAENSTLRVKDGKPAWGVQDIRAGTTVAKLMQGGNYGNHHVAAFLMNDGTLRAVGRSHDYSNAQSSNNHIYLAQTVCVDPYNPPSSRFKAVYRNYLSFFALSEDGVVYSWGSNHYGMLGHSEDKHQPYAKLVC